MLRSLASLGGTPLELAWDFVRTHVPEMMRKSGEGGHVAQVKFAFKSLAYVAGYLAKEESVQEVKAVL